jgi:hypothetical protein
MDLDVASIITASGAAAAVILKAWTSRRSSRTKDLEDRVGELERQLLEWAGWAHNARITAASNGVRLPAIPQPRAAGDSAAREATA